MIPEPKWISPRTLQLLHEQQLERFGGRPGILDPGVADEKVRLSEEAVAAWLRKHV